MKKNGSVMENKKKVVVIGGGHGQSTMLRGLKNIDDIELTAIVTVADDGGSTGRLRKSFHIPAMGDIRSVLISLAESESLLSNLMNYRFEDPSGSCEDVLGHNLGNLILTALTDECGSFLDAITIIGQVLNVKGVILPATDQVIQLYALMDDGVIVNGEANIPNVNNHIDKVFYQDEVHATPMAVQAILDADMVVYGIGSVYTSILPNVIIPEIQKALQVTNAKRIYLCNAMSQPGETDGYSLEDHVDALNSHGAMVDEVIYCIDQIPQKLIEKYLQTNSIVIRPNRLDHPYEMLGCELLSFEHDVIRHDPKKIQQVFEELLVRK